MVQSCGHIMGSGCCPGVQPGGNLSLGDSPTIYARFDSPQSFGHFFAAVLEAMEEERSLPLATWSEIPPVGQMTAVAIDSGIFLSELVEQMDGEPFPGVDSKYAEIPPVPQDIVDELRYCANVSLHIVHTYTHLHYFTEIS